jgi:hypothetical protein
MCNNLNRRINTLLSCVVLAVGCGLEAEPPAAKSDQPAATKAAPTPAMQPDRPPATTPAGTGNVNADAQLMQDFKTRVDAYMDLRKKLVKDSPRMKETSDPGKIKEAQDGLANNIIAARKNAKHGDIFTPEISQLFRRLMYPEIKGPDGAETQRLIKEDAPASVPLKVNAKYPEAAPLPTVPPDILARLPRLPEDLEYRIINNHLILRDVPADLILDFIPNAIR